MGYYTQLYGVDISALQSFCESPYEAKMQALVESKMEAIEDNDSRFADEIEDDWPMTIDAIAEIMMGECVPGSHCPMYGYALEIICDHLGEYLNDDELGPLRNHPFQSRLLESRAPIPIPLNDDFPGVGYLESTDVKRELDGIDATGVPDDDEIAEDVRIYRDALSKAHTNGTGIVAFYY